MIRKTFLAVALACLGMTGVRADFSYEQTSRITGGAMLNMMRMAGPFAKKVREPMVSTIMIKGDRMASVSADSIDVIDVNAETMTHLNLKDRTFAVVTFSEMTQAMGKMAEKMGQKQAEGSAEFDFKVDVKPTGQSKQISGLPAKEYVLRVDLEGKDAKSGAAGAMSVVTDMWMTTKMAGYDEVQNFYMKMAQKMAITPGGGMMAGMFGRPGMSQGMREMQKETAKLDGIPVLQITRMGSRGIQAASGVPSNAPGGEQAGGPTAGSVAGQAAGDAAGQAATGAALGRMGKVGGIAGGLGGFGGFGRKKKDDAAQQQAAAESQAAKGPPAQDAQAMIMELTIETTSFSSGAVDASKFEVPAGFKKVEHDLVKATK